MAVDTSLSTFNMSFLFNLMFEISLHTFITPESHILYIEDKLSYSSKHPFYGFICENTLDILISMLYSY